MCGMPKIIPNDSVIRAAAELAVADVLGHGAGAIWWMADEGSLWSVSPPDDSAELICRTSSTDVEENVRRIRAGLGLGQ